MMWSEIPRIRKSKASDMGKESSKFLQAMCLSIMHCEYKYPIGIARIFVLKAKDTYFITKYILKYNFTRED